MRPQPPVRTPPSLDGFDATRNPPHGQFLATEHWSLLATRSMTWNEILSRTGTYLTVLSATVIALSLVANRPASGKTSGHSRCSSSPLSCSSAWEGTSAWSRPISRTPGW
jgi:hypothetical protein